MLGRSTRNHTGLLACFQKMAARRPNDPKRRCLAAVVRFMPNHFPGLSGLWTPCQAGAQQAERPYGP